MHLDMACSKPCDYCGTDFYRDKRNTWAYWHRARFCSSACCGQYNATTKLAARESLADAFWRRVDIGKDDECWPWVGIVDRDGYGILPYAGIARRAARVALQVDGRPALSTEHACHSCGNPTCCNPAHLYAGSPKANNADKRRHGTWRQGSQIHCAKLTEADIPAIRADKRSSEAIAADYGVSPSNIVMIKNRRTWRHV